MDTRILKPKELSCDPNAPDSSKIFKFWLRTVEDFIASLQESSPGDSINKVRIIISCLSPEIYPFVEDILDYEEIVDVLQKTYIKRKNNVYARYLLLSRQQNPNESISAYLQALKTLAKDCTFSSVSAECYRNELIRDSFINGLISPTIRQRLLEMDSLELQKAHELADSLDRAQKQSSMMGKGLFQSPVVAVAPRNVSDNTMNGSQITDSEEIGDKNEALAVSFDRDGTARGGVNKTCFFCGGSQIHKRIFCPARDVECRKCHKIGHFAKVCRGSLQKSNRTLSASNATVFKECDNKIPSIIATAPNCLSMAVTTAVMKGITINVLFDSGASENFVDLKTVNKLQLEVQRTSYADICMASRNFSMKTLGSIVSSITVLDREYTNVRFDIIQNLCADAILGQEFFKKHKEIIFKPGGSEEPLIIEEPYTRHLCVSAAKVEPPFLFEFMSSDVKPIAIRSRWYSKDDKEFIDRQIQELLNDDVIEPSRSPWRAQVVVVQKDNRKKRMVIDYSQTVNKFTKLDAYPLPKIESIINKIAQEKYYSSLDLRSAYYQVPLKEEERYYTAFEASGRLFQYKRLPFGVTNGVSAFQRIIDEFISRNNLNKTYAYLDDLTVTGSTLEEHDENLKALLDAAERDNLTINEEKSRFRMTTIKMLGYEIEFGQIRPDRERLQPLIDLSAPSTAKELKRINGMFAYYARWISNFSCKAEPLLKTTTFPLSTNARKAFDDLKSELVKASLGSIRDGVPFDVECDASDHTIAAILSQNGRPVAYMSRTLNAHEQNYPSVEKEATAIIEAVRKWSHFLKGRYFSIITDQKSISYMFDQTNHGKIKNSKILMWRIELNQYTYEIRHKPGEQNVAPDAFSRVCSSATSIKDLESLHKSLGHPGFARMYHFVKSRNLPYTSEETKSICQSCRTCAEMKPRFFRPEPAHLVKATRPWERLSMDFKGPLRGQHPYLFVVIDEFSRYPFAFACKNMMTSTVIECLSSLFSLFGYPEYIHSDRGTSFMSRELREFLLVRRIAASKSTPYHPQGNSQCERANQTIWRTIKLLLHDKDLPEGRWTDVLYEALQAIRSLVCLSTNQTPHERMFRFERRAINGTSLPSWLISQGPVLLRRFVRTKSDPLCDEVHLIEANHNYARIRYNDGHESSVSTSDLAPLPPPSLPDFSPADLPDVSLTDNLPANSSRIENENVVDGVDTGSDHSLESINDLPPNENDSPNLRRSGRPRKRPDFYGNNVFDT